MEKIDLRSQMAAGVESGEIRPTSSTVSPRYLTKNLYNIITQGESLFIFLPERNNIILVNEVYEVKEYLSGKPVSKRGMCRAVYQVARWYIQEGVSFLDVRNHIFDWLIRTGQPYDGDVNALISKAMEEKTPLRDVPVYVNDTDIRRIWDLTDSKPLRKLALALLCYRKVYARKGVFFISLSALSDWCGLPRPHISHTYLPALIELGYVSRLSGHDGESWHRKKKQGATRMAQVQLRINVPVHNTGTYQLEKNDFQALYQAITQTERAS